MTHAPVSLHGVTITRPEKALWPATKTAAAVTKQDLAAYYAAAADRLLPHIVRRPISVVRAPDGIDGQHFFQRHAMKGGAHLGQIKAKGEDKPYLMIAGLDGLLELAQAAVLEIHPWGSRPNDPETPERIIFDIDPAPDVAFAAVIEAAKELRARLEHCDLVPFVKTTGGKGLHLVVAVKGSARTPATWPDAKTFAQAICAGMAADAPERFTVNMSKAVRRGRIFLDYLRNDRTATAVAPWSPRARPAAPVAMPLSWSRLRAGLDPSAFAIASAARLLRQTDPWKDFASSTRSLSRAMSKVGSL